MNLNPAALRKRANDIERNVRDGLYYRWSCPACGERLEEYCAPTPRCPQCEVWMVPCNPGVGVVYSCACGMKTYRVWRPWLPAAVDCDCGGIAQAEPEALQSSLYQCPTCGATHRNRPGRGGYRCCRCREGELVEHPE